jgi:hypothetical protein
VRNPIGFPVRVLLACIGMGCFLLILGTFVPPDVPRPWLTGAFFIAVATFVLIAALFFASAPDVITTATARVWYPRIRRIQALLWSVAVLALASCFGLPHLISGTAVRWAVAMVGALCVVAARLLAVPAAHYRHYLDNLGDQGAA